MTRRIDSFSRFFREGSGRFWAGLGLLLLLAAALYPRGEDSLNRDSRQQTVVLWSPVSSSDALQAAAEEFERQHPQYRIVLGAASVRDTVSDPTRFLLGVAGGSPPDVIIFDRFAVVEWAARGAFTDLTPYLEADRARPDALRAEDFLPPTWNEPRWDGRQYAIPNSTEARALYLNDDLLIRAGFTNPDGSVRPPRTWEEICRKKFHGRGTLHADGTVRLDAAPTEPAQRGDVITLRAGRDFLRARIASVDKGTIRLDPALDQPARGLQIPPALRDARELEIKLFDRRSYAVAISRFDESGYLSVAGFAPLLGNSYLYLYGWANGATYLSDDGRTCLLNQPQVAQALAFLADCYDAQGGYDKVKVFENAQRTSPVHPFLTGQAALCIDTDGYLTSIAGLRPNLRFSVAPPPLPQSRLDAGAPPVTWSGGYCYAIPATARNPGGAWELIRFLGSEEGMKLQLQVLADKTRAAGVVFIPPMSVRHDVGAWAQEKFLARTPAVSPRIRAAHAIFTGLLPHAKFRPITPVGNKLWEAHRQATYEALSNQATVQRALDSKTAWVQTALDRHYHPPTGPRVPWPWLIGAYGLLLATVGGTLAWSEIRRRRAGHGKRPWLAGLAFSSPWLVGFIVFAAGPILFSMVISFCRYDVLSEAQFIGLSNYAQLLGFHHDPLSGTLVANDPDFWRSLGNTAFMLLGVPVGLILGLLLATLLNHAVRGIGFFRTLYYLPSIVPAVASFILWIWIFDPTRGPLNRALREIGLSHPPFWLADAAWAKPALILMGLWGVGGGMLIWLAGLKAIPESLYEAAKIDGAGPIRRFLHVTLPMLSPYIFFNLIMGVIGTLQVFESAYVMTDGGPENATMFYAYKLFNEAFRYLDVGMASAMAWILFAAVLGLTLFQLWAGKKWVHYD